MPGMAAYFGLLDVGAAKSGDTVVVSSAAGAVGSTVGQIAKITGCRVVGIAGGAEKCRYVVEELGVDAAVDYKSADVREALRQEAPNMPTTCWPTSKPGWREASTSPTAPARMTSPMPTGGT